MNVIVSVKGTNENINIDFWVGNNLERRSFENKAKDFILSAFLFVTIFKINLEFNFCTIDFQFLLEKILRLHDK